jgi:hypothetical protein
MVMLASAAASILSNCYNLEVVAKLGLALYVVARMRPVSPADRPANKQEAGERLILGISKATAAFSIY